MPETLRQQFLDAAVLRVEKVTPRRVRVRAWIGRNLRPVDSRWLEPGERGVPLPSPPLAEPWEPEPPESDVVWIELRLRKFLFPEREVHGLPLEATSATEVLEDILREVQGYIPDRVRACDGKRVLELERLPLDLLLDEFGRGAVPFLPVASTCSFGFSRMVTGPRRQPPIRGSDRLASCLFGNQMEAVFR